jgi:hypothetical protein
LDKSNWQMIAMKREKQNKTHAFIEIHAHPDDASSCFDIPAVDAANYQRRQPEPDNRCLKQKGLTVNEQIAGPSINPSAGSFIQDLMPLLTNYDSMKMSINIDQFSYVEKLATLTQLYLELRLPLHDALRAAEADL